jgi:hypothetical protein
VDGEVWPSGGLGGGGVVDEGKRFPESSGRLEKKREKSKKKRRALWTFHRFVNLTQLGETVLPNILLKRLQFHEKSRSTKEVVDGAVLSGAGALPNMPVVVCSYESG